MIKTICTAVLSFLSVTAVWAALEFVYTSTTGGDIVSNLTHPEVSTSAVLKDPEKRAFIWRLDSNEGSNLHRSWKKREGLCQLRRQDH